MCITKSAMAVVVGLLLCGVVTGCKRKLVTHVPSKAVLVSVLDTLPAERGSGVLFHHYTYHAGEVQTSICKLDVDGVKGKFPDKYQTYRYVGESVSYLDGTSQVTALYIQDVCLEVRYSDATSLSSADAKRLEELNGLAGARWMVNATRLRTNWVDAVSGNIKFIDKNGALVLRAWQYDELKVRPKGLPLDKFHMPAGRDTKLYTHKLNGS
jgi:hypothetical protein